MQIKSGVRLQTGACFSRMFLFASIAIVIGVIWIVVDVTSPEGKLLERLESPGAPTVEIYMHGFQDNSFDAYVVNDRRRLKICESLRHVPAKLTGRLAGHESKSEQMYGVIWSDDRQRLGITSKGWVIAAYNLKSNLRLRLASTSTNFQAGDELMQQFLKGNEVTQDDAKRSGAILDYALR